jgi:hypothetical protein
MTMAMKQINSFTGSYVRSLSNLGVNFIQHQSRSGDSKSLYIYSNATKIADIQNQLNLWEEISDTQAAGISGGGE